MQIRYTGHHVTVTEALKNYIDDKLARIERHVDESVDIHVILSVEKERQRAEAKLRVNGATLFADAETDDMYAAIDAVHDKLERQARKHKDKHRDH